MTDLNEEHYEVLILLHERAKEKKRLRSVYMLDVFGRYSDRGLAARRVLRTLEELEFVYQKRAGYYQLTDAGRKEPIRHLSKLRRLLSGLP